MKPIKKGTCNATALSSYPTYGRKHLKHTAGLILIYNIFKLNLN